MDYVKDLLQAEAAPTKPLSFKMALTFADKVLGLSGADEVAKSGRFQGAVFRALPANCQTDVAM